MRCRSAICLSMLLACAQTKAPIVGRAVVADSADTLVRQADELIASSIKLDYRRPFEDAPLDRANVRQAYQRACDAGNHRACWVSGWIVDARGVVPSREDRVVANCSAGDLLSCRGGTPTHLGTLGMCEADCDAFTRLQECERGIPDSCALVEPVDNRRRQAIEAMREQGCDAWIWTDCLSVAMLAPSPAARLAAVRRICEVTLGCDDHVEASASPQLAADLLERNCQYSPSTRAGRCGAIARMYLEGSVREPVPNRGRRLRDWICEETSSSWCEETATTGRANSGGSQPDDDTSDDPERP